MLASVKKGYFLSGQLTAGTQRGGEYTYINIVSSQLLRAVQKQWQTAEVYQTESRDYRATADMVRDLTKKFQEALQGELEVIEAKKMSFEQSLKEKEEQLELLEEKSEEARRMQLDATVAKERYLQDLSEEEEARLENLKGGTQVRDVSVMGKPLTPAEPIFPKTFLFCGAFFCDSVGMGAILTAHFLDHV
jgi:uncharacterized protein involved in exopolysaccharide biosynthesis